MTRLFMSGLWVKLEPDDVSPVWYVRAFLYHNVSRPFGSPKSIASCTFREVIRLTKSSSR